MTTFVYRVTTPKYAGTKTRIVTANSLAQQIAWRKSSDNWETKHGRQPHFLNELKIERGTVDDWQEVTAETWKPSKRTLLLSALKSDEVTEVLRMLEEGGGVPEDLADAILNNWKD